MDGAKNFYNAIVTSVLTIAIGVAGIIIGLQALKAFLPAAPAAETAQTVTAWTSATAVVGLLGGLLGTWTGLKGFLDAAGEIKFSKEVDKERAGDDLEFKDVTIDWGSMRDDPVLS